MHLFKTHHAGSRAIIAALAVAVFYAQHIQAQQRPTAGAGGVTKQSSPRIVAHIDGGLETTPSLSPNGRFLALNRYDEEKQFIDVMDVRTGRSVTVMSGFGESDDAELTWSPDSKLIAFNPHDLNQKKDFLWTIPVDPTTGHLSGDPQRISTTSAHVSAFSPDGKYIAYADSNAITIVPVRGGVERVIARGVSEAWTLAWSADAKWIYYSSGHSTDVRRVPVNGGSSQSVTKFPPQFFVSAMVPERWFALSEGRTGSGRIVDASTGRITASYSFPGRYAVVTSGNPAGTRFYGAAWSPRNQLIALNVADGSRRIIAAGAEPFSPALVSPGRLLYSGTVEYPSRHVKTIAMDYKANTTTPLSYASGAIPPLVQRLVSPDGRYVFSSTANPSTRSHIYFLDLRTGREREITASGFVGYAHWRSDSRSVLYEGAQGPQTGPLTIHEVTTDGQDRVIRTLTGAEFTVLGPCIVLNDDFFINASLRDRLEIVPTMGGTSRTILNASHGAIGLSPDGNTLAVKTSSSARPEFITNILKEADQITFVDLKTAQTRTIDLNGLRTAGHGNLELIRWMPDGKHILLFLHKPNETSNSLYLVSTDGTSLQKIAAAGEPNTNTDIAVTPDGKSIFFTYRPPTTADIFELTSAAGRE